MIEVKSLKKIYKMKDESVTALDDVSLKFDKKGMVFILGKSGSGKSTILNIEWLKGVKTLVNSRLEAILSNGERVCVTRKYLKYIREALIRRNS